MATVSKITRKEFLKLTGLLAGGVAIGAIPLLSGCGSPGAPKIDAGTYTRDGNTVTVMLEKVPELSQVGSSAALENLDDDIHLIIARTGEDRFAVALNQCPHRERAMGYDHESEHFICSTGKSEYRLDGSIVKAPVENPLPVYRWHFEQDRLVIEL